MSDCTILYRKLTHYVSTVENKNEDFVRLITTVGVPLTYSARTPLTIYANSPPVTVPCGVFVEVPDGYLCLVVADPPSAGAARNVIVPGTPWVAVFSGDADAGKSEICVPLANIGQTIARVEPGACVARLLIIPRASSITGVVFDEEYMPNNPVVRTHTVQFKPTAAGPVSLPATLSPEFFTAISVSPTQADPPPKQIPASFDSSAKADPPPKQITAIARPARQDDNRLHDQLLAEQVRELRECVPRTVTMADTESTAAILHLVDQKIMMAKSANERETGVTDNDSGEKLYEKILLQRTGLWPTGNRTIG